MQSDLYFLGEHGRKHKAAHELVIFSDLARFAAITRSGQNLFTVHRRKGKLLRHRTEPINQIASISVLADMNSPGLVIPVNIHTQE